MYNLGVVFFHLTQATYRKVNALHLANLYKDDNEFAIFVGMMDSLALLPVCDVKQGMAYLQANCPEVAQQLLDYFDETYVNGAQRGRSSRRSPPLFPPKCWNQYEATLAEASRTNNFAEAWNRMFKGLIGHKHPSIWTLVKGLRKDAACVQKDIQQAELGELPQKRKLKPKLAQLQLRQLTLARQYAEGDLTLPRFLRKSGKNIRHARS